MLNLFKPEAHELTDRAIAKLMWQTYQDAPLSVRLLASARTYICPMQPLLAEVPSNSTILDIGCGNGLFLSLLIANHQIKQAVGVEPNTKALSCAELAVTQLLGERSKSVICFSDTSHFQDWVQEQFSVVSMIDVMHHIPPKSQRDAFEAAVQRVSPDGLLIYKDMCQRPFWRAVANRLHDLVLARQWIHYMPLKTVKKWADAYGLILEKEQHYSRYAYGHELLVFRKAS